MRTLLVSAARAQHARKHEADAGGPHSFTLQRILDALKSEATRPMGGIGLVLHGMLRPRSGGKSET